MPISRWAAPALLLTAFPAAAASTIVPAHPVAQQAVELRLSVDSCSFNPATVQVAATGNTLRVTQRLNNCLVPGTAKLYDVRLGNFPAGDYRVEVYDTTPANGTPAESLSFTVTNRVEIAIDPPPVHPLTNYSGLWFDPGQPGWGLALAQDPVSDSLFGAWFTYLPSTHAPSWTTLQNGHWTSATGWAGGDYTSTGPAPDPADHTPVVYGTATPIGLDFGDVPSTGTMTMSLIVGGNVLTYRLKRYSP